MPKAVRSFTMRTLRSFAVLTVLLSALVGCGRIASVGSHASLASAERFEKALGEQLQQTSGVAPSRAGGGQAMNGSVRTKSFSYVLPAASFAPGDLRRTATAAVARWGEMATFPTRNDSKFSSTGIESFELSFGSSRSHAFIDCLAYRVTEPDGEKTHVMVLIRVFEGD